ncbi:MAG: hypothetical protein ACD_19C00184G0005 [uncultured bacterium]|nr:MAG: hypothetical protein ACD_19C00184G0005 [uncultured bacterium]
MPQDNNPVVAPVDPTTVTTPPVVNVADVTNVTPAPVTTEPTVMDATQAVPGPEAVKVELPKVEETPVVTPIV